MLRFSLLLAAGLVFSGAQLAGGAESVVVGTFQVDASSDAVHRWYLANKARVFTASNSPIVEARENNEFLVKTSTPLGECRYIVREINEKTATGRSTLLKFVRRIKGRIENQVMHMTITDQQQGCHIRVKIYTDFRGFFVTKGAVKDIQDESLAAIKKVMQGDLNK